MPIGWRCATFDVVEFEMEMSAEFKDFHSYSVLLRLRHKLFFTILGRDVSQDGYFVVYAVLRLQGLPIYRWASLDLEASCEGDLTAGVT